MELKKSKQIRRIGVTLNFSFLFLSALLFELIRFEMISANYKSISLVLIPIVFITHYNLFGKTGLWKFTHKKYKLLDEREIQLTNHALRFSFALFAVSILSYLLIFNWLDLKIHMVEIASFLYLAHILPAYYISWTEESTINEE